MISNHSRPVATTTVHNCTLNGNTTIKHTHLAQSCSRQIGRAWCCACGCVWGGGERGGGVPEEQSGKHRQKRTSVVSTSLGMFSGQDVMKQQRMALHSSSVTLYPSLFLHSYYLTLGRNLDMCGRGSGLPVLTTSIPNSSNMA